MIGKLLTKRAYLIALFVFCAGGLFAVSCAGLRGWNRAVQEANEQALRNNLSTIRSEIQGYVVNKKELPQTLDDLAGGKPFNLPDPITGKVDWQVVIGENRALITGKRGIIDVHSGSTAVSSQGTRYDTW